MINIQIKIMLKINIMSYVKYIRFTFYAIHSDKIR